MATSSLSPITTTTTAKAFPSSFSRNTRTRLSCRRVSISTTTPKSSRIFCCFKSFVPSSYDHVPKQFREENLKDGLMDNYKSLPKHFYGLTPSQMNLFTTEDNPFHRQSENVSEESISAASSYMEHGGMNDLKAMSGSSMRSTMYHGGGGRRVRSTPPDLPSILLDSRIIYLGMPIVPEVTELIVAQFMWLDYTSRRQPIYLYINSPGTKNENMENVGSETDAYAIADCMDFCKAKVYTVNLAMAHGQAAMLLALGAKGYRAMQPNSSAKLYLPTVVRSSGAATDMWIKAKELDANTDYYIDLVARGTGKSKEEMTKDLQGTKFFLAQEAIDYGLADRIVYSLDGRKKDSDGTPAKSIAPRRPSDVDAQEAAPSGVS